MEKRLVHKQCAGIRLFVPATLILLLSAGSAWGGSGSVTYTLDADFDQGTLINVNHDAPNNDQLQLNERGEAFGFIWVAASARGTIVKIDTETGEVLGEYRSAPQGMQLNPSRTTVDANGNVWAGNRNESSGGKGSVVHIGLEENGQCVDRNGNGVIDTSSGLSDILPWSNSGGADTNGGVTTADDECIIHYVRTSGTNVRTVAVDGSNNVWIGGFSNRVHELYDQNGIAVPGTLFNLGCGGYGGLVDGNGVLWSANISLSRLLRYDTTAGTGNCIRVNYSYGLGIDSNGYIWNSMYTYNTIAKISPAGLIEPLFPKPTYGANGDRGVAVTTVDDNVWIANSHGSDVSRLDNDGNLIAIIPVGSTPTGVAVDAAGKVWVTNLGSNNVMRIDPATNLVDLTVNLGVGARPYNYSDMTGSTLTAAPDDGNWTVDYDSGVPSAPWREVSWTADVPGDSALTVTIAGSDDGITFGPFEAVANGGDPTFDAQYLRINVAFSRSTDTDADSNGILDGPILYDLTALWNRDPDCSQAAPSIDTIWPPNHKFVPVDVLGVTDPDGDVFTITVQSIYQDEPVDTTGDGQFAPDGQGIGTATAEVRAERSGNPNVPGNGRVYHIGFNAVDTYGGSCSGVVQTGVPHDKKDTPIDEGPLYDSSVF